MTEGGPAYPVQLSSLPPDGGPAVRVAVVSDGRPVQAGPSQPIQVVLDGRPVQGNVPMPIAIGSGGATGGPAMPVVVVSGDLLLAVTRSIAPANLVDIWKLDETSGTTAAAVLNSSHNASYRASVAPGTLWPTASGLATFVAPALFPATGDILFPAAGLASGFPWNEGSFEVWMRATAAAWDEATLRRPLLLQIDSSNRMFIQRSAGADTLVATYTGGGTSRSITVNNVTQYCGLGWLHICLTWSRAGDVMRLYLNGHMAGSVTGLTAITGTLAIPILGGNPYSPNFTYAWAALWSTPLTQNDVTALITPVVRDRLLIFEGDSLTVGGQLGATPYPKQLMRARSDECAGRVVATSGQKVSDMIASFSSEIAALAAPSTYRQQTVIILGGTNDIQNEPVATAYARLRTFWSLCRSAGLRVVASTLPAGNPAGAPNYNTDRAALNTLILSDTSLYTAVARPDLNANIGQDGDETNPTYFNADRLHLTTAGYAELAASIAAAL